MPNDETKSAIRTVIAELDEGLRKRDVASVARHHAADATIFDLAPPLSHRFDPAGLAAWISTWSSPVIRETRELGITVNGDLAVWHGFFHTSATTLDGEHRAWWERATLVFRRESQSWKVVHEHTSVPFHMDGSLRAATDLSP